MKIVSVVIPVRNSRASDGSIEALAYISTTKFDFIESHGAVVIAVYIGELGICLIRVKSRPEEGSEKQPFHHGKQIEPICPPYL